MQRLIIRVYKATGQTWVFEKSIRHPNEVEELIEEYSGLGLIFHTGFEVLPNNILNDLLPSARDGIVFCAATKAIMGRTPFLFKKEIQICKGLESDNFTSLKNIADWFFFIPAKSRESHEKIKEWYLSSSAPERSLISITSIPKETIKVEEIVEVEERVEVVSEVKETDWLDENNWFDESSEVNNSKDINWLDESNWFEETNDLKINFDKYLLLFIENFPEFKETLLSKNINNIHDFYNYWINLNIKDAHAIASFLLFQSQELYRPLLCRDFSNNETHLIVDAIINMSKFMPPWDNLIPEISIRIDNIFLSLNILTWNDLSKINSKKFLDTPRLGGKTIMSIFNYLVEYKINTIDSINFNSSSKTNIILESKQKLSSKDTYLESKNVLDKSNLNNTPNFSNIIISMLDEYSSGNSDEKNYLNFSVLKYRLLGETLKSIGERKGVTRERVRQRSIEGIKKINLDLSLVNTPKCITPLVILTNIINNIFLKDNCSEVDFNNFVRVFSNINEIEYSSAQIKIIESIFEEKEIKFILIYLGGENVLAPVPMRVSHEFQEGFDGLLDEVSLQVTGFSINEAEIVAESILSKKIKNNFIGSMLAREIVYFRGKIDDQETIIFPDLVSFKEISINNMIHLLRSEAQPLHGVKDIYERMPASYRKSVGKKRVETQINEYRDTCLSKSGNYIFPMGRGRYSLWEHFNISEEQGEKCASFIEKYISKYENRQFSDRELYEILKKEGLVSWFGLDQIDSFRVVSVILMRYQPDNVRYMGRFVWASGPWTDESDTSGRYRIQDLVESFIKEQGKPVTKSQLDEYIRKYRGVGVGDQYYEHYGLIRLHGTGNSILYWHPSLDPISIDSLEVKCLKEEAIEIVQRYKTIFMRSLKEEIILNFDIASKFNSWQFLALLLRIPELSITQDTQGDLIVQIT